MVALPRRRKVRARGAPQGHLVLHGRLHGDLDRDRSAVGVEDLLEPRGSVLENQASELDGGLVRESAEHDVGHRFDLLVHGALQFFAAVAVERAPPGASAVQKATSVCEHDLAAFGLRDLEDGRRIDRPGVGVPEVSAVKGEVLVQFVARFAHALFVLFDA